MNLVIKIACFTLLLVNFANSGVLPVKKCSLEDSACLLQESQKALPTFVAGVTELGTPTLDVLKMDDVSFDLSGFQFSLFGGQLEGLKSAVFKYVAFNTANKVITMEFNFDGVLTGRYKARGNILVLPIEGDGDLTLKLKNMHLRFTIPYEIEKKDGKTHIVPKKLDFEYEVIDNAEFGLTNLFNGNKTLSDNMLTFLNKEWKTVSVEFGQPLVKSAAVKIYKAITTFFKKQSLEELAAV